MDEEFDVSGYTDEQLYNVLDLTNPSDRELEAKIVSMIRKYSNFGNESGQKLAQFFMDIYNRFFDEDTDADSENDDKEGFTSDNLKVGPQFKTVQVGNSIVGNGNVFSSGIIGNALPDNVRPENIFAPSGLSPSSNGVVGTVNLGNRVETKNDVSLTKTLEYSKDKLNPLLKQTIKRIISIDSQYRNQDASPSTNFTFNLSEPLKDVVSLSLYSIQIPYTWYTVNSDYGGNFFYLKGNSPGIMNGFHDYKFEIKSGNYTPSGLIDAVNLSIQNVSKSYMDVSFGTTRAIYNDGVANTNSGTGKTKLEIDITKIYNEGNFTLLFPNWSPPTDDVARLTTIAGYLGFDNTEYYCSSIYSGYQYRFVTESVNDDFDVITVNHETSLKIVPYIGDSYLTATTKYTEIQINLNLSESIGSSQTIRNMVTLMNTALINNVNFDVDFTSCVIVDVPGTQKSYVKMSCKLNNRIHAGVKNLKLAAIFPNQPVTETQPISSLFYGQSSFFAFLDSVKDSNLNVICEFSELTSENAILQSSYLTTLNSTSLEFECTAIGYDNDLNKLTVNLPQINNVTLPTLISTINATINERINAFKTSQPNFSAIISLQSLNSYIYIKSQINNVFVNSNYRIYVNGASKGAVGNLPHLLGLSDFEDDVSPILNSYSSTSNFLFTTVAFNENDIIYVVPRTTGNNRNSDAFEINLNSNAAFGDGYVLAKYLTDKFITYSDPLNNLRPFAGTIITYNPVNGSFTLNLNILTNVNSNYYNLTLKSTDTNNNIWKKLVFNKPTDSSDLNNFSFVLKDYENYTIQNNSVIKDNTIRIIKNSNDTFYLSPSNKVDVFNTSNGSYLIPIKVNDNSTNGSGTLYSITELLDEINSKLSATFANGTVVKRTQASDGRTLITFRFNINKMFTTKDYVLVFYDPYSFNSCFSNASKRKTSSLQNATWDSTLGWLLGYRNLIYYALIDYVDTTRNEGADDVDIYYLTSNANKCILIGDTSVSTNLYNYFLIMLDDYSQNHLNDGLVTITNQETVINHPPAINYCNPVTGKNIFRPADYDTPGITYTAQQLSSFNQQVQSKIKLKSYSSGPFVKDIFGIIPVKTAGISIGSVYVEFGGSLQNQQRLYFGPVNIHRMTIKLLNDRGNLVDLNNANWSFSFICEHLYKNEV